MIALYGARKEDINTLGGIEKFYNLIARVQSGMLEMYRRDTATSVNVEKLRASFDDAQHKIARAGIENPAATGQVSAWHCARMAWLVVDPVESHLNDHKIAIFLDFIKQKQDTVRGFFAIVRSNKVQLP